MMSLNCLTVLIQCQFRIKYIIKKHETLSTSPPTHIYIKKINNRLVLKRKDGYKLESQTSETMKLFVRTKKSKEKTKNGENLPSLEVVEEILVRCNW